MKESTMIKICLTSIVIGLVIMFVANRIIEPPEIKISEINESMSYLKIKGNVTEVSTSKSGTTFIKVEDNTGLIDVIVFRNSIKNIDEISRGHFVEVLGKPDVYRGKLELIGTRIQILSSVLV